MGKKAGRLLAWPLAIQIENRSRYTALTRFCIPCNQVASLDVVPNCMPRPPAKLRSSTSLQMVRTHAPQQRGFFKAPTNEIEGEDEREMEIR